MSDEPQPLTVLKDGEGPAMDLLARADLPALFSPFRAKIDALIVTAGTIKVTNAEDRSQIKLARDTRLELKRLRVAVGHKKDELKSGVLKLGRAIDSCYKEFVELIEPHEKALMEQEKIAERLEAERAARVAQERIEQLNALGVDHSIYMALGSMDETTWDQLLENSRLAKQKRDEEAARAQQEAIQKDNERLQREKEAEAERQRVLAENERLKAEAAEREKAAAAQREADDKARAEKERQEAEASKQRNELQGKRVVQLLTIGFDGRQYDLAAMSVDQFAEFFEDKRTKLEDAQRRKEADEAEKARLKQIADKAEAQRVAAEQRAAADRKQAEETARLEREQAQKEFEERLAESNRKAQEAQKAADDAAQAERDRLEYEAVAEKARALKEEEARRAPDREKLIALAATLRATALPEMVSEAGSLAVAKVEREIEFLAKFIEEKASKL